jgi:serine protease inhibitor
MKKVTILLSLMALPFSAILAEDAVPPQGGSSPINIVTTGAQKLIAPEYGESNLMAQTVASGANDFAFRLSATLVKKVDDENFIFSPYSVWMPLAALVNATNAQNRPKLLAALNASGVSSTDINNAASRMLYDLTNEQGKKYPDSGSPFTIDADGKVTRYINDPLKIANAIFVNKTVTLKKSFAQTFMDFYRGNAISVDFASKDAVDAVNKWASENTDGLITSIVRQFNPDTVAAIANAIYFSDRWDVEFLPQETTKNVFHSPKGDVQVSYMLRETRHKHRNHYNPRYDNLPYYEDDKIQATSLRFKTTGGMYILLPKDGNAVGLLSNMTKKYFDEIRNKSAWMTGKLMLPRFSFESGLMELSDTLKALGIPLFDGKAAPLTGGLSEENIPVWLSGAVQKALIRVDENGTTAAAVSLFDAPGSARAPEPPAETFEMICDKPFVFILYGDTHDGGSQVLFTGIVNKP